MFSHREDAEYCRTEYPAPSSHMHAEHAARKLLHEVSDPQRQRRDFLQNLTQSLSFLPPCCRREHELKGFVLTRATGQAA